jgi:hypothetical protein
MGTDDRVIGVTAVRKRPGIRVEAKRRICNRMRKPMSRYFDDFACREV